MKSNKIKKSITRWGTLACPEVFEEQLKKTVSFGMLVLEKVQSIK